VIHSVNPRLRGAARIIWILIAKFFPCGKKAGFDSCSSYHWDPQRHH
jgi:hypothetical protein